MGTGLVGIKFHNDMCRVTQSVGCSLLCLLLTEPTSIEDLSVGVQKTFQGHLVLFSWKSFGLPEKFKFTICSSNGSCVQNSTMIPFSATNSSLTHTSLIIPPLSAIEYLFTVVSNENGYEGTLGVFSIKLGKVVEKKVLSKSYLVTTRLVNVLNYTIQHCSLC